jgi:hypothetical protein
MRRQPILSLCRPCHPQNAGGTQDQRPVDTWVGGTDHRPLPSPGASLPCLSRSRPAKYYGREPVQPSVVPPVPKKTNPRRPAWSAVRLRTSAGCSVPPRPVGNQTSQFFANLNLDPLDHFVKEQPGFRRYCRYCNDFLLFSHDKTVLASTRRAREQAFQTMEPIRALRRCNPSAEAGTARQRHWVRYFR